MQSPSQKSPRIHHSRRPSLSFNTLHFPSDRQFPIYAHCNSQRHQPPLHFPLYVSTPPRRQDLMQTIDYRYTRKCRRSSFALSDIFELDEDEVEIEVSPVLPSTSTSTSSISTTQSVKSRMKTVLFELAHTIKMQCNRVRSARIYVVEPADCPMKVDLL
ncbi:hypothetical protein C8Q80DRAFT_736211 [Daedaleopsis nitida]|nr:hypothetical protein C8Q80DRAFT_736211 [Daedaleopsis nitida]